MTLTFCLCDQVETNAPPPHPTPPPTNPHRELFRTHHRAQPFSSPLLSFHQTATHPPRPWGVTLNEAQPHTGWLPGGRCRLPWSTPVRQVGEIRRSTPVRHVGEIPEQPLVILVERSAVFGRGQDGAFRRELLIKVTDILHATLEQQQTNGMFICLTSWGSTQVGLVPP